MPASSRKPDADATKRCAPRGPLTYSLGGILFFTTVAALGAAGAARGGLSGFFFSLPLAGLITLGAILCWSAAVYRRRGWITGLVFGLILLGFGLLMGAGLVFDSKLFMRGP